MPAKIIGANELHKRITKQARSEGRAVDRTRRWVGVATFFALLEQHANARGVEHYHLKGGAAVELRFPTRARTSEDLDITCVGSAGAVEHLLDILKLSWDRFAFEVRSIEDRGVATRLRVGVIYNNVAFCTLMVDVVEGPALPTEPVAAHDLTRYGLPAVPAIPCLALPEQIAQYLHAITRPAKDGESHDRGRNIVDLYLFDTLSPCDDAKVVAASMSLFAREGTHEWPPVFALPPLWTAGIDELISELELETTAATLEAYVNTYLARLLGGPITVGYEYRVYLLSHRELSLTEGRLHAGEPLPLAELFAGNPNIVAMQKAIDEGGFRIAHLLPYDPVAGTLVFLERPKPEPIVGATTQPAQTVHGEATVYYRAPAPPRLQIQLTTEQRNRGEAFLVGDIRNIAEGAANKVRIFATGVDDVLKFGTLAKGDDPLAIRLSYSGQQLNMQQVQFPTIFVEYVTDEGIKMRQVGSLQGSPGADGRWLYIGTGLGRPEQVERFQHAHDPGEIL
jgi:hypothetical protein